MPTIEKIVKRNGQVVDFEPEKIVTAVEKAFKAVVNDPMHGEAVSVKDQVVRYLVAGSAGSTPTVEKVQDLVERALMERGFFDVAKDYIIYRYEHSKQREEKKQQLSAQIEESKLLVTKRSGKTEPFSKEKLKRRLTHAVTGYEESVNLDAIITQTEHEMFHEISTRDVSDVTIMVTRSFIERDPAYSHVAARLLLDSIYADAFGYKVDYSTLDASYRTAFVDHIQNAVAAGHLDPRMAEYDLQALAAALKPERDDLFRYLGLQTLWSNYFMKEPHTKTIQETPQAFWMRVAMGTALTEETPEARMEWAIAFYEIMSDFYYTPSSPTLYHAGWSRPQLSSCFLSTVTDDLHQIFRSYSDDAQLLKYAGGVGNSWTSVRATGSLIASTGVESQGVIPFLKIANDVTVSINRSGRRRGASAVYLETWHYDIEDFIMLRKQTGDERRRCHDLNTVNWIPDLFMKRVEADEEWTLFTPSETPDLHDLYGRKFEEAYVAYEEKASRGEMHVWKRIKAKDLWRKMITMIYETGHPWITFKDPSNIRQPQDHYGVVHNSNLCTEITLVTNQEETAVCNLGSLNYARFVVDGAFSSELVEKVVPTAMRMLDNVIEVNYYPTERTKTSNQKHRPVGLGIRGVQDALYLLGINFDSKEAVEFADSSMEVVAYHTILASALLAKERGAYETYKGSKWDRNILPQDTITLLESERGLPVDVPRHERLDWTPVRQAIKQHGMRNSNTMAIAPTATTANIVGCFPTIEPIYKNLYVKSNMAGDFVVVNSYLVEDLKALGLWGREMLDKLKMYDGSVQEIDEIPQELKDKYQEIFDIDARWLIDAAAFRGRWIDQSQSLNIFYRGTSGKDISDIYLYAWKMGLKTTYYLRTTAATKVEKSTMGHEQFRKAESDRLAKRSGEGAAPAASTPTNSAPVAEQVPTPAAAQPSPLTSVGTAPKVTVTDNTCTSCEG
ncbi:ribonucleoside-diphosphate reductase subunit alpha [Patescibacteria group bacterium]|jgi:ribonucleoside-diphosphate reductase alpha chain|nr:ribonucleoside-diphosphate reductase subunit alpha [Patescibacteria group bacterium]